ncbi:hypothetical protein FOF46_30740 [Aquimarina algiphila]|uniref:Phage portal protein n=2 Tax=Aquimarina algiphila TaxID=2047982 RepID=A0A554VA28_9FLAO|nr:hypothetical protein [Aquimarina algiphila]TSE02603.1 hypothetical protein FOF46_30740 [Aquimarina algiphila]
MKQTHGVYFGKASVSLMVDERHQKPTKVIHKGETNFKKGVIAPWGDDNRYPNKFMDAIRLNGAASGGLSLLKSAHYGNGLTFYKNQKSETTGKREKVIEYKEDHPEVQAFFKRNKMNTFFTETINDLESYGIGFPSLILSKDYKKVLRIRRQKTAWGRRELMNPSSGFSEMVYFKNQWDDDDTKDAAKIHSVDPMWCYEEILEYCRKKRIYEFVLPVHYTMTDEAYYPKPTWHAIFNNGWLEVSNSIPMYKKHLFKNQLNIKFLVHVSEAYFEEQYGDDWTDKFDVDERNKIREETLKAIDDHLSGNESSGRSMYSRKLKDDDGKWVNAIEIEPIDNKMKEGSYLPDATAANTEILFAMMVDASLIGGGVPGGNMGSGSGSDKRVAFDILSALFKTKRDTTLQIWDLIKEWNGWDPDLQAGFENVKLTTLDKNPNGKQSGI